MSKVVLRQAAPDINCDAYHNGFKNVKLSDYKGQYVVLFFYPLDFTFVCPTEIINFNDRSDDFKQINCQVIGCSVDSKFSHMEYTMKPRNKGGLGDMKIPLLADINKTVSRDYGVLIDHPTDDACGVALRGTFIIDDKGILRHMSVNDLPVGRNVDEVLRLVEAFQFTDKHGEVCPASWKKGDPTMQADPNSKKTEQYW